MPGFNCDSNTEGGQKNPELHSFAVKMTSIYNKLRLSHENAMDMK